MLLQTYATQFLCSLIEYYLIVKGRLNKEILFLIFLLAHNCIKLLHYRLFHRHHNRK